MLNMYCSILTVQFPLFSQGLRTHNMLARLSHVGPVYSSEQLHVQHKLIAES